MSKASHNAHTLGQFSKTLTALAKRVSELQPKIAKAKQESVRFQYERDREKGLAGIEKWVREAHIFIDSELLRASDGGSK